MTGDLGSRLIGKQISDFQGMLSVKDLAGTERKRAVADQVK